MVPLEQMVDAARAHDVDVTSAFFAEANSRGGIRLRLASSVRQITWKAEGFHVVSLNTLDEIAALEPFASRVAFVELPAGHQRPLITDFFDEIAKSKYELAGIIDADCLLFPGNKLGERLAGNLDGLSWQGAPQYQPDDNVAHRTTLLWVRRFLFRRRRPWLPPERDDSWRIGDTWWDYWLPLSLHLAGQTQNPSCPEYLPTSITIRFGGEEAWIDNGRRLFVFLHDRAKGLCDPELVTAVREPPKTTAEIHALQFQNIELAALARTRFGVLRKAALTIA